MSRTLKSADKRHCRSHTGTAVTETALLGGHEGPRRPPVRENARRSTANTAPSSIVKVTAPAPRCKNTSLHEDHAAECFFPSLTPNVSAWDQPQLWDLLVEFNPIFMSPWTLNTSLYRAVVSTG